MLITRETESYISSGGKKSFFNKLFLGTRWGLYADYIKIVVNGSRLATKGLYSDHEYRKSSENILKACEGNGGQFHITGLENLKLLEGPCVVVSNHMSTLETQILPGLLTPFTPISFIIKDALLETPFMGDLVKATHCIGVTREDPREDLNRVMTHGVEMIKEKKRSVVIFPEATRQDIFDPLKFNSLGVRLALKAGVSYVPIAVKTDFWGNGKLIKDFGPVRKDKKIMIAVGKPLFPEGKGKKQHQEAVSFISNHLAEWGSSVK